MNTPPRVPRRSLLLSLVVVLALAAWLAMRAGSTSSRRGAEAAPEGSLTLNLAVEPPDVIAAHTAQVTCTVTGAKGRVRYTWHSSGGAIKGHGASVTWEAPGLPGAYKIKVVVEDSRGQAEGVRTMSVRWPSPGQPGSKRRGMVGADAPRVMDAEIERRIRELHDRIPDLLKKDDVWAHDQWRGTMEELGGLLLRAGRYEEAREVYWRLLGEHPPDDPRSQPYRRGYGVAAFYLGRDEEARRALADAQMDNDSKSFYYLGLLQEQKGGSANDAIRSYDLAAERDFWYPEPAYRAALLRIKEGDVQHAIDGLVKMSPGVGRDRILERLATDPELAPLKRALEESGRMGEIEEKRPIVRYPQSASSEPRGD